MSWNKKGHFFRSFSFLFWSRFTVNSGTFRAREIVDLKCQHDWEQWGWGRPGQLHLLGMSTSSSPLKWNSWYLLHCCREALDDVKCCHLELKPSLFVPPGLISVQIPNLMQIPWYLHVESLLNLKRDISRLRNRMSSELCQSGDDRVAQLNVWYLRPGFAPPPPWSLAWAFRTTSLRSSLHIDWRNHPVIEAALLLLVQVRPSPETAPKWRNQDWRFGGNMSVNCVVDSRMTPGRLFALQKSTWAIRRGKSDVGKKIHGHPVWVDFPGFNHPDDPGALVSPPTVTKPVTHRCRVT